MSSKKPIDKKWKYCWILYSLKGKDELFNQHVFRQCVLGSSSNKTLKCWTGIKKCFNSAVEAIIHTQWKDFLRIFKGKAGLAVTLNQAWLYGMPGRWISCQRCPRCGCGANGGNMEECADWMVGMVGMFGEAIYQQQTQGWTEQPPRGWHTARVALHKNRYCCLHQCKGYLFRYTTIAKNNLFPDLRSFQHSIPGIPHSCNLSPAPQAPLAYFFPAGVLFSTKNAKGTTLNMLCHAIPK